jgi:hypothetical protein
LACDEHIHFSFRSGKWKKGLNFSCFSFWKSPVPLE